MAKGVKPPRQAGFRVIKVNKFRIISQIKKSVFLPSSTLPTFNAGKITGQPILKSKMITGSSSLIKLLNVPLELQAFTLPQRAGASSFTSIATKIVAVTSPIAS